MSFSVRRFKAFITSKGNKTINHRGNKRGGHWCNCAVGDFYRHTTGKSRSECSEDDYIDFATEIACALPEAHARLNTSGPRTYAQLLRVVA